MAIGTATDTSAALERRNRYEIMRSTLLNERASFDAHWRELAEFFSPRRPRFETTDVNKGDRRSTSIIDSHPRFALRTLASGMHAGLTSPARPWMRLTTPDPDLAEFRPVKEWLHTVTRRMLDLYLRSNVYNVLPMLYADMGLFATGAMGLLEDQQDVLRAYSYPLGSFALSLDNRGLPATWLRDFRMTVRQLVTEYGVVPGTKQIDWSRFSQQVQTAWREGNYELQIDVCWYITPNDTYDRRALYAKDRMPFRSCHFERGREDSDYGDGATGFLRESGFNFFPIRVPRWDVTGEDTYGTDSPGMTALGDAKQLQLMQRHKGKAIAKAIDPPLVGPTSLMSQEVSLVPGKITYEDTRDGMHGLRPIHEVRLEGLQYLIQDMQETRQRISSATYADLFLMLASREQVGTPVTAREIDERHEEKLLALGPVLERTNDELLDPMTDRCFDILLRAGGVPEPPEELMNMDLKVDYLSIMAQAQKLVGVAGQDRYIQSAISMAEVFPNVRHKVNVYVAMDNYAEMLGVAPQVNRTTEEAQQLEAQEAQQQQAMAAAEQSKTMAQAGQALGNTPLGSGGSALDAVLAGTAAA